MAAFSFNQRQGLAGRERDALKKREAGTRARRAAQTIMQPTPCLTQQPSGNAAEDDGARGPLGFEFFPSRLNNHGIPFLPLRPSVPASALKPLA